MNTTVLANIEASKIIVTAGMPPTMESEANAELDQQKPISLRKDILDAAAACVLVDRQETHGSPEESFTLVAELWSAFLGKHIQPHEVCAMMMMLKAARLKKSPQNLDNWVDVAGYAACGGELAMALPVKG